jgi:acetyl esterase/lipase
MTTPSLDPELAFLADLDVGFGRTDIDVGAIRTMLGELLQTPPPPPGVEAGQHLVRHDPPLVVETFAPAEGGNRPCVLWFHGGGFLIGSAAMDAARLQEWTTTLGCVTVSVEYRLAPEHPYPAAHDDAVAALEWVIQSADALGVDTGRIVVGGASAGGGLAAATVLAARDRGLPLAGQLLLYPMLDDRQQTPSSRWEAPVWPPAANQFGWRAYLGSRYGQEVPAYAAPARCAQFEDLPPTLLVVGGADGFFDEDLDYVNRLTHAGVLTDLLVLAGAPHGFDMMAPDARATADTAAAVGHWLATLFDRADDGVGGA